MKYKTFLKPDAGDVPPLLPPLLAGGLELPVFDAGEDFTGVGFEGAVGGLEDTGLFDGTVGGLEAFPPRCVVLVTTVDTVTVSGLLQPAWEGELFIMGTAPTMLRRRGKRRVVLIMMADQCLKQAGDDKTKKKRTREITESCREKI